MNEIYALRNIIMEWYIKIWTPQFLYTKETRQIYQIKNFPLILQIESGQYVIHTNNPIKCNLQLLYIFGIF